MSLCKPIWESRKPFRCRTGFTNSYFKFSKRTYLCHWLIHVDHQTCWNLLLMLVRKIKLSVVTH